MSKKGWLIILILTSIVVFAWVITDIILSKPSQPANPKLQKALDPVSPNFDTQTLEQIQR